MIRFNRPYMTGKELGFIEQAHRNGHLSGDGPFTKICHDWLRQQSGAQSGLLTPVSYTHLDVYKRQVIYKTFQKRSPRYLKL